MTLDLCLSRLGRTALLAGLTVLAACANPPARTTGQPTSTGGTPAGGQGSGTKPAPVVVESPPAAVAAPVLSPQEVQRAVASAVDLLQAGQEDQAETELARVLQSEPGNRLAQSLMKQIKEDPVAALGRESFAYRVQAGESLSRIAQRFMGDVYQFYILARYNNIKVPRTLAGGQTIRVPGKAPPPSATNPPPARDPAPSAPPVAAPTPPTSSTPAAENESAAGAKTNKQKTEAVTRHTRAARAAFAKQDLEGALRSWDAVLAVDAENRTALLERQKVLGLMEKLGKVK